ncbi:hypothetical protein IFM89_024962 [Coptis chinensis]|uniref:Ribosomal eL28/Mak16 domain-containing protein n=1 Tax=Coptis chinensis TaxID=261450 RepID=A0A835LX08_9MAGN|nr:hypothetical protein IFM89_024962 [Coptis chinensis]
MAIALWSIDMGDSEKEQLISGQGVWKRSRWFDFKKEPNNLYNLNSFKHSGLANKKTVAIQGGGKDLTVELATTKTKKQNQPGKLKHKSVMNKEFYRMAKAVSNQVGENHYRPDLKNAKTC